MRVAPLDFRLRVEAGERLVDLGEVARGLRILRSCADYFTLAGFPLRALWALKLYERLHGEQVIYDRGLSLLARHYAHRPGVVWGEPIFEMPLPKTLTPTLEDLPNSIQAVVAEIERRATDIFSGTSFPNQLPAFPVLSTLSAPTFLEVIRAMTLRRVADGHVLVEQGEVATGTHFVVTGRVHVRRRDPETNTWRTLASLAEEAVFGEMALVTGSPRLAQVQSEGRTTVLEIPHDARLVVARSALEDALVAQVAARMVQGLAESELLAELPEAQRVALSRLFQPRVFEAGEPILREGVLADRALYLVLDGVVDVVVHRDGRGNQVAQLNPGDVFGEISLVRHTPATATCVAAQRTLTVALSGEDYDQLAVKAPEIGQALAALADHRLLFNMYTLA